MFIVQESVHGDHVSRHEAHEDAVAAIEEMIRSGLANSGDYNIREIDENGATVGVSSGGLDVSAPRTAPNRLDGRRLEVLRLLAAGETVREISIKLSYSEQTIKTLIRDVEYELHARNRAQAVAEAIRQGLI